MTKEFEALTTSYEFEDRAVFFIEDVKKLARRYRSALVEVENTTFERMEDLLSKIKVAESKGRDKTLLKKLRAMEYGYEVESAAKNSVLVTLYSRTSRPITPFGIKLDALAKTYRGVRRVDQVEDYGSMELEENYRFIASFIYDFKNDFKK